MNTAMIVVTACVVCEMTESWTDDERAQLISMLQHAFNTIKGEKEHGKED